MRLSLQPLREELLRGVDAWGPAREETIDESHVTEHIELHAALLGAVIDSISG